MKLIVGLGNPDARFECTRHNAGFLAVEAFAGSDTGTWLEKWEARVLRVRRHGSDALLAEPLTYMNLSGRSVGRILRFHGLDLSDLLVVHDEVDLPLGRMKVESGGGDNGHRGIRSVIENLGTDRFARLRFGVGRPRVPGADMVGHVLSKFGPDELDALDAALKGAVEAIEAWLAGGVVRAQNRVNRRSKPAKPSCPGNGSGPLDRKEDG